ncbi:MAG: hypothetical protein Q7S64_03210, partial [bacterium]|nr:hypothetical protein [bacterium]
GRKDLTVETTELLHSIAFTEKTVELLVTWLRRKYYQRVADLQKRREEADEELKSLYELRQALIEKNLTGVYTDEMFKEQNKLLEDKIKVVQIAKDDELLTKYNLEKITDFIQEKLNNVAETFATSTLHQIRVLLCSIFPSGMPYGRNGYSNTPISPFYSAILDLQKPIVTFGGEGGI